ncbi:hypothetical protein [Paraburkholderia gardini]|uniref:hypothetical protein n=1 Tax=Paraburkholderia gardini TaxID=2823469 RepID=UPI001E529173|nr:hypothetical protein [Paraburkholderia gardini]
MLSGLIACAVCGLLAGCGGSSDGSSDAAASQRPAVNGSAAPAGAGGAGDPVPIVALPASGPCAASGTPALQAPGLNSQIDCAP